MGESRHRVPAGHVDSTITRIIPHDLNRRYPVVVRGDGVWVVDSAGTRYLDAMSGGSMALTLGHGRRDIVAAACDQAARLAYVSSERLTTPPRERLARELASVAPQGFGRVHFVTGGAEANEAALRLARTYHVERGEQHRWKVISAAQAYHGPTMATLALTGRPGLWGHYGPYLPANLHVPPSTRRLDPTGELALEALDRVLADAGPETVSLFFCEVVSGAALPAYTPPTRFWKGLDERRSRHGFLIGVDEVVTGLGRAGSWFAANELPLVPDIIATAKGLGAGYAAIGATLCREHVYDAIAAGSGRFRLGNAWGGAPLPCAVGEKVIEVLRAEGLIERVRERGPRLRWELEQALGGIGIVDEVRGHGFLLGVEYVDPRDRESFLPPDLGVAGRVDDAALAAGLVTLSTQPTRDGYAGDQSLFAPSFTATDEELAEMVARFAASVRGVADEVERELSREDAPAAVPGGKPQ
jgi:adenosylmethionine-8-amino-7-oxononanoate aminotransferase